MPLAFQIGFLPVDLFDLFDILIVGYLIFSLYKLLRGSIALNIFVGIGLLFVSYQICRALGMDLLSNILYQFIEVGFISLIIIFQPEVRRFLLLLGNSTLRQRDSFWNRLLGRGEFGKETAPQAAIVRRAFLRMSRTRTGALMVFAQEADPTPVISGGTLINAEISYGIIMSIFHKESPLHDGAVIVQDRRIVLASAILPVSENSDLPAGVGTRHRAAVGISEKVDVACFIVSEENGKISFAYNGQLERGISEERLMELLDLYL